MVVVLILVYALQEHISLVSTSGVPSTREAFLTCRGIWEEKGLADKHRDSEHPYLYLWRCLWHNQLLGVVRLTTMTMWAELFEEVGYVWLLALWTMQGNYWGVLNAVRAMTYLEAWLVATPSLSTYMSNLTAPKGMQMTTQKFGVFHYYPMQCLK